MVRSSLTSNKRRRHFFWLSLQSLVALALSLLLLAAAAGIWPLPIMQRFEWLAYDWRVNASLPNQTDPQIIIVDLDERSLYEVGQWPWPRERLAQLMHTLFTHYQLGMLGMDIIFAEPENNLLAHYWALQQARYPELAKIPAPSSGDQALAQALAQYPVILGYHFQSSVTDKDPPPLGLLPKALEPMAPEAGIWQQLAWITPKRYTANIPLLQTWAQGGGFFDNPLVDQDGVFRRVPLLQAYQQQLYPSLPLAMFLHLLGQPPVNLQVAMHLDRYQLEGLDIGGFQIPVDQAAGVYVPWYGKQGQFKYFSATDILHRRIPQDALAGSLAIMGATAPGLLDLRSTPVGNVYPGVEVNASLLAGLLHQNFRAHPRWMLGAELVSLTLISLLTLFIFPRLQAFALFTFTLTLTATWLGLNWYFWQQGWILPVASGLVLIVSLSGWHLVMNFWRENQEKARVAHLFGQYIPAELVHEVIQHKQVLNLSGEQKELSVLFSDVRNFTRISESLTPHELTELMNQLLNELTQAIQQHRGTIDKYMGDAVMAFWGAPLQDTQHAYHAVLSAFAMQEALAELNPKLSAEGKPNLTMGVGINTGTMHVGNMGSNFRMAYTVMGDNVNLASRLEGLTKIYQVPIIISETTVMYLQDRIQCRRLDQVRVKGRQQPIWIYQPFQPQQYSADFIKSYHSGLEAYQNADFHNALIIFDRLAQEKDPMVSLYRQRCQTYLQHPPPSDWDGVFSHKNK